jgi:hypothetical protein
MIQRDQRRAQLGGLGKSKLSVGSSIGFGDRLQLGQRLGGDCACLAVEARAELRAI